jgi:hypothetical protein
MTEFKMPYSEIEERFTLSEIVIMAWSSQEQLLKIEKPKKETEQSIPTYKNKDGEEEPDPSKMTGKQAYSFFSQMGMHFPIVHRSKPVEEKLSEEIQREL